MNIFTVTVRTAGQRHRYTAFGASSGDVHAAALACFGGLCSVVVIPAKRAA